MRCFLGSELDDELVNEVRKVKSLFKETNADIKFVSDENLHFTVKFLGDVEKSEVGKVDRIEKVLEDFDPFQIELQGVGVFPSKDYIKVIWIGVGEGWERFKELLEKIDDALSEEGFRKEKNEIVPHLTIGRVKSGKNKDRIVSTIEELEERGMGGMKLKKIGLFKSDLTPDGPVYKRLKDYKL